MLILNVTGCSDAATTGIYQYAVPATTSADDATTTCGLPTAATWNEYAASTYVSAAGKACYW